MRSRFCILVVLTTTALAAEGPYRADWSSLSRHVTPRWLQDAKFGIYTHVSLQTVRNLPGNADKYTHELIGDFRLERFDPNAWADLFVRAGARFAGPVSWHGSGFLHWNSALTRFDTVDMGPHRDLAGELKRAVEARGLKFLMSFHTGYWWQAALDRDNPGRTDPAYEDLYGPAHDLDVTGAIPWKNHIEKQSKPNRTYQDTWLARMDEAVTRYQPDVVWLDTSFGGTVRAHNTGRYLQGKLQEDADIYLGGIAEPYQQAFLAHLFNTAASSGQQVALVYKEHDVPPGVGMRNIENGLLDELTYDPWMTDIDICLPVSWFYRPDVSFRSADAIIDLLVDVVSKNGVLLLNVPPRADGTFDPRLVRTLGAVGDWLRRNGEAIYDTVPWSIYGEGPSALAKTGHYSEGQPNAAYGVRDIRYTQRGETLYAISLGVPGESLTLRALGSRGRLGEGDILGIDLLGSSVRLRWTQAPQGLTVHLPADLPSRYACVLRVHRRAHP